MTASRPRLSLRAMLSGHSLHSKCTISVCPAALATIKGVWWSSFRLMPLASWPRASRVRTTGRWPREHARCREVLERPRGEKSGLWRRYGGWDLQIRATRRGSLAWIARRRRNEGSILGGCQLRVYLAVACVLSTRGLEEYIHLANISLIGNCGLAVFWDEKPWRDELVNTTTVLLVERWNIIDCLVRMRC